MKHEEIPAVTEEPLAFIFENSQEKEEINLVIRIILFLVYFLIKIWGNFCGQINIYLATKAPLSYSFFKHFFLWKWLSLFGLFSVPMPSSVSHVITLFKKKNFPQTCFSEGITLTI